MQSVLKKAVWVAGFSLVSLSVSAFEIYQGDVVLFGPSLESEKVNVSTVAVTTQSDNDLKPDAFNVEPRLGEVLLDEGLSERASYPDAPNRHSELIILPQNNEVQFLDQAERNALLDLLTHLQQTDVLIQRAQAYQRPDQRIKFRYDWLRHDLHKINRSILDHLNSPENQTRFFEPLNEDYRR